MNGERGQSAKKRKDLEWILSLNFYPQPFHFIDLHSFFVTMAADHQLISYQEDPFIYKQCDEDIIENVVTTYSKGLKLNFNLPVL